MTSLRPNGVGTWRLRLILGLLAGSLLWIGLLDGTQAHAASRTGRLSVVISGLPAGQRPSARVVGPGVRRPVRGQRLVIGRARAGRYTITITKLRFSRDRAPVRKGATALPTKRRIVVVVRKGRTTKVSAGYGTIINPNVVRVPDGLQSVLGDAEHPSGLVVRGDGVPVGALLTSGPTTLLPAGIVARVTRTEHHGATTTLSVTAVPVTEAVPVINTDGETAIATTVRAASFSIDPPEVSMGETCGLSASTTLVPIVRFSGVGLAADINTVAWNGGPRANLTLSMRPTIGFRATATGGVFCKKDLVAPPLRFGVPVGPVVIPGYVTLVLSAKIAFTGTVGAQLTYSFDVQVGVRTRKVGIVLIPSPVLETRNSRVDAVITTTPKITAETGLSLETGLGDPKIANVHLSAGTNLEAVAQPSGCTLDWNIGASGAGGKAGIFSITSPTFTAYTRNIARGCGRATFSGSTPATPPPGTPPALPPGPVPPPNSRGNIAIASGGAHSCALRQDGQVACWGSDFSGQLGDGMNGINVVYNRIPVGVIDLSDAAAVGAGANHSCASRQTGQVACWGLNDMGQLGDGTTTDSSVPVAVQGLSDAAAVGAGANHSCALRKTGQVACWGSNGNGQLGNGTFADSSIPVTVQGLTDAIIVAVGRDHSCALRQTGQVSCWGFDGRLGVNPGVPVTVQGLTDAAAIAAGGDSSCAVRRTGQVVCWGSNGNGQLGDGTTTDSSTPVSAQGLTDVTAVSVGGAFACALRQAGPVVCWGANGFDQLGDGTSTTSGPDSSIPVAVQGLTDATAIASGSMHSCALRQTTQIDCWGSNSNGQLGHATGTSNSSTPGTVVGFP